MWSQISLVNLLVSRNLTTLLLSFSPEFRTFQEKLVHDLTIIQIPNTLNVEIIWQAYHQRDCAEKSTFTWHTPGAITSGSVQCSYQDHTLPGLFPPMAAWWGHQSWVILSDTELLWWAVFILGSPLAWPKLCQNCATFEALPTLSSFLPSPP